MLLASSRRGRRSRTIVLQQRSDGVLIQFNVAALAQVPGEVDGTECDPDQPADGEPDCLKEPPDFAIAPLLQDHAVPAVRAFAPAFFQKVEVSRAILEGY